MITAWHIYFTTYGTWLHGDERGSRNRDGSIPPDPLLLQRRKNQLTQAPAILTPVMRTAVDAAIREVCVHRGWKLSALNVRSNHVHIVVAAQDDWSKMLHDFKAYATRRLRAERLIAPKYKVWTAKGGHKRLENSKAVSLAVDYVLNRQ